MKEQERPNQFVITVLAKDRVGIIADVSETLFQMGGNLEALSQTVVWGWFTMIICASFPESVSAQDVQRALEKPNGMAATVLPFEKNSALPKVKGDPFIVTASGEDRPGIVRVLTACFARKGINIEDVWNEVREEKFIVMFHILIPDNVDPKEARYDLEQAAREAKVDVTLQHLDIFTATNSISLRSRPTRRVDRVQDEVRGYTA